MSFQPRSLKQSAYSHTQGYEETRSRENRVLKEVTLGQQPRTIKSPNIFCKPTGNPATSKIVIVRPYNQSSQSRERPRDCSNSLLRFKVNPFPVSSLEKTIESKRQEASRNGGAHPDFELAKQGKHGVKIRASKKVFYKNENFSSIKNQLIAQFSKTKDNERLKTLTSEINICHTLEQNMKLAHQSRMNSKENSTYLTEIKLEDDKLATEARSTTHHLHQKILNFAIQGTARPRHHSFKQLRRGISLDTKESSMSNFPEPALPDQLSTQKRLKARDSKLTPEISNHLLTGKAEDPSNISITNFQMCLVSDSNILKAHIKRSSRTQKNSMIANTSKVAVVGNKRLYPATASNSILLAAVPPV